MRMIPDDVPRGEQGSEADGRHRLLASVLGSAAGLSMALAGTRSYWQLAGLLTAMALGLAFTDVLTDALTIAIGVAGTLAYLAYRDLPSAIIIDVVFGCANMITFLAFLDLAARACPRRIEGTFFALLMAVYNAGTQASHIVGGYLDDSLGYGPLVLISAATSALTWALVPLIRIDRIEARARKEAGGGIRSSASPPAGGRDDSTGPPGASGVPT